MKNLIYLFILLCYSHVTKAQVAIFEGRVRIGSVEEIFDGGLFLLQVNSALAPETNGNRTLGTSSFRWSTVYATNGTISTSDRRDKSNIQDITYGLKDVLKLRPVSFTWTEHPRNRYQTWFDCPRTSRSDQ